MYTAEINGISLQIEYSDGLFCPKGADRGTLAMLKLTQLYPNAKCLDLGCGCGIVGIYLAKALGGGQVFACDIDPAAVQAAQKNAAVNGVSFPVYVSDGVKDVPEAGFDFILSNPPYQSDFAVAKGFIEKGFNRLKIGGRMVMVTKRRPWYENKLRGVFGGCRVEEEDGYFVFTAEKRRAEYAKSK